MTHDQYLPPGVAVLGPYAEVGILDTADIHFAATLARVCSEATDEVLLASALAVRAPRLGHVCVDLSTVADTVVSTAELELGHLRNNQGDNSIDPRALPWPEPKLWIEALSDSPLVARVPDSASPSRPVQAKPELKPLILDGTRLYLSRFWYQERYVAADLVQRCDPAGAETAPTTQTAETAQTSQTAQASQAGQVTDDTTLQLAAESHIRRLFGDDPDRDQLEAALAGSSRGLVVISGGPGTGKTTTVSKFLAGLISAQQEVGIISQIALAAPTGKAAARMTESIRSAIGSLGEHLTPEVVATLGSVEAVTIHRLLGRRGSAGFKHGPTNRLPHDLVIIDEVSMVSMSLMAHLLSAVRHDAKVVLVGDPYQLASVEAGVVLGDIVGVDAQRGGPGSGDNPLPPAAVRPSVRPLLTVHRQASGSPILDLSNAVRSGDVSGATELLRSQVPEIDWVAIPDGFESDSSPSSTVGRGLLAVQEVVTAAAAEVVGAALNGEVDDAIAGIGRIKVLCGQRVGPTGVMAWNKRVEDALRAAGLIGWDAFYAGRPVMVTENDYLNNVSNGDVGVAVASGSHFRVWFPDHSGTRMIEAARLDRIATQWAMTIHKSQGSEFPHVVVSLPPSSSRVLTRELLYTAITRAKQKLTIVSSAEAISAAIARPVSRATGLRERLELAGTNRQSLFVEPT